jgi:hypothetical protein
MKDSPKTIKIDNVEYVPKEEYTPAKKVNGLDFVIVRTYSAGVFAGYLKSRDGKEVKLYNAIRIWQWYGAASLSQLAMEGTKDASNCKFAVPVNEIDLTEAIEVIYCSEEAKLNIESVPSWKN